MPDINSLSGSNLFAALLTRAEEKSTQPSLGNKRKKKKGKKPPPKPEPKKYIPLQLRTTWTDKALVLFVCHSTCNACGTEFEVPNNRLFVHRTHPVVGEVYKDVNELGGVTYFSSLPQRIEHQHSTCPVCPCCFIEAEAYTAPLQYTLPLFLKEQAA